ncbi:MAG: hypothetical protein IV088_13965 [Hydrogenophaga sp.]|uniref:hypothetical protein n=1 Tax=Hydrogenophaga sp. TaxID=1904254 RepID=UPI0025BB8B0C|nr:hypothetical protein [Hydrogenophaga sp.]MBT9551956.1 hypothetical protein [Hydrogenophaga sp.]
MEFDTDAADAPQRLRAQGLDLYGVGRAIAGWHKACKTAAHGGVGLVNDKEGSKA